MYNQMLAPLRLATNYANAENLKTYGGRFDDPAFYNDPKNANILNRMALGIEESMILQLYCSRYTWTCNDDKIPTDFIEYMLFYNGMLAFFHHDDFGWLLLPCSVMSIDVYGRPNALNVTLPDASGSITIQDFVLLRDNPALNVPHQLVQYYARMIGDTARTLDVYVRAMKKPLLIDADFKSKQTAKEFAKSLLANENVITLDRKYLKDTAQLNITQDTSHNAEDLKGIQMYKASLYNECIARLGITTPTIVKQAQVNQDEINKNDAMTNVILNGTLECRQRASKLIFEKSQGAINLSCQLCEQIDPENQEEETKEPETKQEE